MSTDTTPRELDGRFGIVALAIALAASVSTLALALPLAQRHARAVREAGLEQAARAQALACQQRLALFVPRIADASLAVDPHADAWSSVVSVEIPLQRQTVTMPMLEAATVDSVRLQGLTDGRMIAWRVSWPDASVDANVDMARFSDAVALQFPITRGAAFTMGEHGKLVQILHWKALWQKDVDEHFQDVQDLHPNYWADLYWFAEGRPYTIPESFRDPRSHQWFAAYSAGNPMANIHRALPVEELVAEGYGSLSPQTESLTVGSGGWRDGEWAVVFARPLRSDDQHDYQFGRGSRGSVGVAVWDGAAGNVGGRKHWTDWVEFEVSL